MEMFEVIILAIIQAVTEFVPVSSSGHLIAASDGLNIESTLGLDVMLHFGTLVALVVYFWSDLIELLTKARSNYKLIRNIILTTIPAAFFGALFNDMLEDDARKIEIVIFMLVSVGLIMIFSDRWVKAGKHKAEKLNSSQAWMIGLGQSLALIPGTSRSGITMLASRKAGLSNKQAARYSFLVGIPIIFGATVKVIFEPETQDYIADYPLNTFVGVMVAATVGLLVLPRLIAYLSTKGLVVFGWYRLALAGVLFIILQNQ